MLTRKQPPANRANWTIEQWLTFALEQGLIVTVDDDQLEIGPDSNGAVQVLGVDQIFGVLPIALSMLGLTVEVRYPEEE